MNKKNAETAFNKTTRELGIPGIRLIYLGEGNYSVEVPMHNMDEDKLNNAHDLFVGQKDAPSIRMDNGVLTYR